MIIEIPHKGILFYLELYKVKFKIFFHFKN
jgi:hypothetical protein